MKRVFVQGSYDILNAGHCLSLKELKDKFGYVVVGLNSDELMMEHKGRVIIPFEQRKGILLSLKYVDEVICCDDPMAIYYLPDMDAFATVQEWVERQKEAIDYIKSIGGEVYILKYYPEDGEILSSTQIRERVIKGAK
jgi:cytidyltransferase-like protein